MACCMGTTTLNQYLLFTGQQLWKGISVLCCFSQSCLPFLSFDMASADHGWDSFLLLTSCSNHRNCTHLPLLTSPCMNHIYYSLKQNRKCKSDLRKSNTSSCSIPSLFPLAEHDEFSCWTSIPLFQWHKRPLENALQMTLCFS